MPSETQLLMSRVQGLNNLGGLRKTVSLALVCCVSSKQHSKDMQRLRVSGTIACSVALYGSGIWLITSSWKVQQNKRKEQSAAACRMVAIQGISIWCLVLSPQGLANSSCCNSTKEAHSASGDACRRAWHITSCLRTAVKCCLASAETFSLLPEGVLASMACFSPEPHNRWWTSAGQLQHR